MTEQQTADPTPRCLVCHRPRAEWGVCAGCVTRVDGHLAELLDLHALAASAAALEPGRSGEPGPTSGHRTPPPPLSIDALDLAVGEWLLRPYVSEEGTPVWSGLETWERDWRAEYGLTAYGSASAGRLNAARTRETGRRGTRTPGLDSDTTPTNRNAQRDASRVLGESSATLVGVIGFLRAWWPRAAADHPAADEFAADIRRMHTRATAVLHLDDATPWTVPCPADTGAGDCGYRLAVDHSGRELLLHCPRCGSDWDIDRLLLVAASAGRGVWVTVAEAAEHVGVHRSTVHRAVAAGTVTARWGRVDLVGVQAWAGSRLEGACV